MIDRYITNTARRTPYAAAIQTLQGDVSYARFDHEIGLVAAWLSAQSLEPQKPVVVRCADKYLHWLLLLACARCDIPTASISHLTPAGVIAATHPQLYLTDRLPQGEDSLAGMRVQPLSPRFAGDILGGEGPGLQRASKGDARQLIRISTSSGTTGTPKRVGLSGERVERRLVNAIRLNPAKLMRFLPLVGPESGAYDACVAVWSMGGTVIFGPSEVGELAEGLTRLAPGLLAGAPIQLQHLLEALPPGMTSISGMNVSLFGAHTPMSLRAELTGRLSADVSNIFGSTEAGLIASAHVGHLRNPSSSGFVFPWVDLEVVDDQDAPLPAGELGRLRIRSPDAVDAYMDDPASTARYFKDGWFYPGDVGSLSDDGMLRLEGRSDDVLNAGGEKMLPLHLEEAALGCVGVADAAGFMAPGRGGEEAAWIALVANGDVDKAALAKRFAALGAPAVNIAWVKAVPRNERGKIKRDELRTELTRKQARDVP